MPQPSGTSTPTPLPSITGLSDPTTVIETKRRLAWWEILLMALGCAFIFLVVLLLWRRRARKQRAKRTAKFAEAKKLDPKTNWRWRLVRFGEKLFGHRASKRVQPESEELRLIRMREAEEARHYNDMDKLIGSYQYPPSRQASQSSRAPSTLPSLHGHRLERSTASQLSGPSIYSQVTGKPRRTAESRQPVKNNLLNPQTRYSSSTLSSGLSSWERPRTPPTDAELYADAIRPTLTGTQPTRGAYWLEPNRTGGSSRNPFRV